MTNRIVTNFSLESWDLPSLLLKTRLAKALDEGISRYPIHRTVRFAARTDLDALLDQLAVGLGWQAQRIDGHTLILDSDRHFVVGRGSRKAAYCSCSFSIWARDAETAENVSTAILAAVEANRIREPMFSIDWHFLTTKGELRSTLIEEMADDVLHDGAYPTLTTGVKRFIDAYLDASETVLVVQGPPGTGKTRLIRGILGEMSRRSDGAAQALYTGDKKSLESDEIFVEFITGHHNAFIVEDADHVLKPRAQGNEHLHRFLTIADGIVRSQGRKIIFSTNLPNIGDLDEALVRPGRCHAHLLTRELTSAEAAALARDLSRAKGVTDPLASAHPWETAKSDRDLTLAEIYRALRA